MKPLTKSKQDGSCCTTEGKRADPSRCKPDERRAAEVAQCCAKTARVVAGCHD